MVLEHITPLIRFKLLMQEIWKGRNANKEKPDHRLRFFESFPERASSELPRVQFAFIDASHLFDLTMLDFLLVDKLLESGRILALHDAWMPAIKKVVRFALTNRE